MTEPKPQVPPVDPNAEKVKKVTKMWDIFYKECKALGFVPQGTINIKSEVDDGMTKRERKLCEIIVATYLVGNIQMTPVAPIKVEPAKATESEEKTIEKLEDKTGDAGTKKPANQDEKGNAGAVGDGKETKKSKDYPH